VFGCFVDWGTLTIFVFVEIINDIELNSLQRSNALNGDKNFTGCLIVVRARISLFIEAMHSVFFVRFARDISPKIPAVTFNLLQGYYPLFPKFFN
jgi:hypothetical protein